MLRVGRLADYGILILHHLGRVQPARLSMEAIAGLTHVPLPTVRKVMRYLTEARLVVSKRGPNGGYQLARPPAAINLAEAIAAVEGTMALTDCCGSTPDCELMASCELAGRWPGVNRIILRVLERTSLADLDRFGEARSSIPPHLKALFEPAALP